MKIKFTTNYNCLGEYDECVLAEADVKTIRGLAILEGKSRARFADFSRMSSNYRFNTVIVLDDGSDYFLSLADPGAVDFVMGNVKNNMIEIDEYKNQMSSYMGEF